MFGREITLPLQAVIGWPSNNLVSNVEEYVATLRDKLIDDHEIARVNLGKSVSYQKKYYDTKAKTRFFRAGQMVWLHDPEKLVYVPH